MPWQGWSLWMLLEDYSPTLTSYFCLTPESITEALLYLNQTSVITDISDYSEEEVCPERECANCWTWGTTGVSQPLPPLLPQGAQVRGQRPSLPRAERRGSLQAAPSQPGLLPGPVLTRIKSEPSGWPLFWHMCQRLSQPPRPLRLTRSFRTEPGLLSPSERNSSWQSKPMTPRTSHVTPTDAALLWHIHFLRVSRAGTHCEAWAGEGTVPSGKRRKFGKSQSSLIYYFFSA